nr:MAG TPA: hypothetical protein [Microviridae sp.]
METEKEKLLELLKALYKKSPIAAVVIVCIEFGVIVAIFLLLSACTSNLFVQKGNSSSSISSQTSPSVTTKMDSTKVVVPINQKQN